MVDPRGFLNHPRWAPAPAPPAERLRSYDEHYEPYSDSQVKTQASRCMDCGVPFCMSGCPLGNLIPDWNDYVHIGRWRDALMALHATNNFPEFTGRICPAPCEHACVLGINEPPVSIKLMEQAIVDKGFAEGWIRPERPLTSTGKTVAIVGSGPAGLACAQQLARAGHQVTVYEKSDRLGGLLMYGIPDYKLAKAKILRRIDQLEAEGVHFKTGVAIGRDLAWSYLRSSVDALVIAIGAEQPRSLGVPGADLDGVHAAMEFLPQATRRNLGDLDIAMLHPAKRRIEVKGKRIAVIGGGDTASDCIGNCLRLGAKEVFNLDYHDESPASREPDNPWPQVAHTAHKTTSLEEMLHKGGALHYRLNTTAVIGVDGKVTGIEACEVDWSQGRPPKPVPGTTRVLPCDLVLVAIGYAGAVRTGLSELGVTFDQRGRIISDPTTHLTSAAKVFAAGDARRGQSLVVWAIAEGREVARCVDASLTHAPSLLPAVRIEPFGY